MLILVKTPFTEYVPGEGMVVGNMGRIVSLPDKMAGNRIEGGFGEESTQEAFDEQEAADAEFAAAQAAWMAHVESEFQVQDAASPVDAPVAKVKLGRKPRAAASPVDAPVA